MKPLSSSSSFPALLFLAASVLAACVPGEDEGFSEEEPSSSQEELFFEPTPSPSPPETDDPTNPRTNTPPSTNTRRPTAPSRLQQIGANPYSVKIYWNDNSYDETYFRVERRRRSSTRWTNLGGTNEHCLMFGCMVDTGLDVASQYCYRVRAEKRLSDGRLLSSDWASSCSMYTRGDCPETCGPSTASCDDTCTDDDGSSQVCGDFGECVNDVEMEIEDLGWDPQASFAPEGPREGLQVSRASASFRWNDTKPKPQYDAQERPTLWYVEVTIPSREHVQFLDELGIHYGAQPLFGAELVAPDDGSGKRPALVPEWVDPTGLPILFAIVPGPVYNELRDRTNEAGQRVFQSMPDRVVRVAGAHNPDGSLSYQWVVDQGLDWREHDKAETIDKEVFDAIPTESGSSFVEEPGQANFIGSFFRKLVEGIAKAFHGIYRKVREGFSAIRRRIEGSADLEIEFVLMNRDPGFADELMFSGWKSARNGQPEPIRLAGVKAVVKQGAGISVKKTDSEGRVRMEVVSKAKAEVCFRLENDHAVVMGSLLPREICTGNHFQPRGSVLNRVRVEVRHRYANIFAQATDSRDFARTEMGKRLRRVHIMTGAIPNLIGKFNEDRPFVPCIRGGNLGAAQLEIAANWLLQQIADWVKYVPFPIPAVGTIASFVMSADVLMMDGDGEHMISRGVMTHEYGHFAACEFMGEAGAIDFGQWWYYVMPQVIGRPDDETFDALYIHEAIADVFAWMVVGGFNYFGTTLGGTVATTGMDYCNPAAINCIEQPTGFDVGTQFNAEVGRIVTLLHDVFDDDDFAVGSAGYFSQVGGLLQLSSFASGASIPGDEGVTLPKSRFPTLLENYTDAAPRLGVPDEETLETAIFETIGYDAAACELYSVMDNRSCTTPAPPPAPEPVCSTNFCGPTQACCPGLSCVPQFNTRVCMRVSFPSL